MLNFKANSAATKTITALIPARMKSPSVKNIEAKISVVWVVENIL